MVGAWRAPKEPDPELPGRFTPGVELGHIEAKRVVQEVDEDRRGRLADADDRYCGRLDQGYVEVGLAPLEREGGEVPGVAAADDPDRAYGVAPLAHVHRRCGRACT